MTTTFGDPEAALREWARLALTGAGGRVFFSWPESDNATAAGPVVTLSMIASPGDEWGQEVLVQFDVWADTRAEAAGCAAELCGLLEGLNKVPVDSAGVRFWGAYGVSSRRFYEQNDALRRFVVEATVSMRALTI